MAQTQAASFVMAAPLAAGKQTQMPDNNAIILKRDHLRCVEEAKTLLNQVIPSKESGQQQSGVLGSLVKTFDGTQYAHAFEYKGRYLEESPALHMAIWLEATDHEQWSGTVARLVRSRANTEGHSTYYTGNFLIKCPTLVVAAGLGNVDILKALTQNVENISKFVNRDDNLATSNGNYYYTALHEACFVGSIQATIWLLEKGSDTTRGDFFGNTPLHLLTKSSSYDDEKCIERAVKDLIKHKAPLGKMPDLKNTPLQLATSPAASFPKKLHYLLSPAFQYMETSGDANTGTEDVVSFLVDFTLLARNSPQSAELLANQLLSREDPSRAARVRDQLERDVQIDGRAHLKLADIMFAAPQAATRILQVLLRAPKLQDPVRYKLRRRTRLWALGRHPVMRCQYRADAMLGETDIAQPTWFHDSACEAESAAQGWHTKFLPAADDVRYKHSTYDVKVAVIMAPNILGVDMMQALSQIWDTNIFEQAAIAGVVNAMWDTMGNSVSIAKYLAMIFFEVAPLLYWGLSMGESGNPADRLWDFKPAQKSPPPLELDSPREVPLCWSVLAGVVLKECVEIASWVHSFLHRYWAAKKFETYTRMWSPCRLRSPAGPIGKMMLTLPLGWLLWQTCPTCTPHVATLCFNEQALLSLNLALRVSRLLYAMRLVRACGAHIIAITNSFLGGAMVEMFGIMTVAFLAFMCVNLSLRRQHGWGWEAIYLYRALIFGDGDGLSNFGISSDDKGASKDEGDPMQHTSTTFYGILSTLLFNVIFLNLIIAIYSDEYNRNQVVAVGAFRQHRAKAMTEFMLMYHRLGRLFVHAQELWFSVIMFILWMFFQSVALASRGWVTCSVSAILLATWQLAMMTYLIFQQVMPTDLEKTGKGEVERATMIDRGVIQVNVKIHSDSGSKSDWEAEARRWLLVSSMKLLGGFHTQQVDCLRPVSVSEARIDEGFFKATLTFAPVRCMDRVMTLKFWSPAKQPGAMEFALPRFVWICYREDRWPRPVYDFTETLGGKEKN